jgi:alpha-L-fucosidase
VAINYKKESFPARAAVLDIERGQLDAMRPLFWQTDTSISKKSWGYITGDEFRSADSLIDELVDIVSKNGTLLLNIGPRPDGTIPEQEEKILLEMGRWLAVNGDAIYGTRPWKVFGEGPTKVTGGSFKDAEGGSFTAQDVRFTAKGDTLYAIVLAWPEERRVAIKSLGADSAFSKTEIKKVALVGSKTKLKWNRGADGLHVDLPAEKPSGRAFALKIWPVERAAE